MAMWNPWRGCHRHGEGCKYCYIHKADARKGIDTNNIRNEGYANVTVGCTVENQSNTDDRLSIFNKLPIKHKNIICQPMIEKINLEPYLHEVELVVLGGESDKNARPLDYDWVLAIRKQCEVANVHFEFRQCGTYFIKDGKKYTLNVRELCSQARKANINI